MHSLSDNSHIQAVSLNTLHLLASAVWEEKSKRATGEEKQAVKRLHRAGVEFRPSNDAMCLPPEAVPTTQQRVS